MWKNVLVLLATAMFAQEPSVKLPPELARVLTDYETGWRTGDGAGLAKLFVEDGFVLTPQHAMVRGRTAIEKAYSGGKGQPLFLRAVAYATEGNIGYIIGAFSHQPDDSGKGKFTLTLEKDASGRWLIKSDMDN